MKVGLFVPCYVDAFHPEVGMATLELLERFGLDVTQPLDQTCCGQLTGHTGSHKVSAATEWLFVKNFRDFDYIVCPCGSCAHHLRRNLDAIEQAGEVKRVRSHTFEPVEFLHDFLEVESFSWAGFPHKVSLHVQVDTACNVDVTEILDRPDQSVSKLINLLTMAQGLELSISDHPEEPRRVDGTFSVSKDPMSAKMDYDPSNDREGSYVEYVTSSEHSCFMHQEGCFGHEGANLKFIPIAQILNGVRA